MGKVITKKRYACSLRAIPPSFLVVTILGGGSALFARDYKVDGGVSVGYERYDRRYDKSTSSQAAVGAAEVTTTENLTSSKDDEYDRFRVAPRIVISALSVRDETILSYSPSFRYDFEATDHDVDHDLSVKYNRFLTRHWQVKLSEKYLLTDAVLDQNSSTSSSSVQLSDSTGRRKYSTNNAGFVSEYTYWEDSLFSFGYNYGILENVDAGADANYQNYDRHESSLSVAHRFDSIWKMTATAKYVRGLYDKVTAAQTTTGENTDQDLSEYRASTMLESRLIDHHPLSLTYNFLQVAYDDATLNTSFLHDVTFGWQWDIAKEFRVNLGGGPSYQETEGQTGNWGYNANAGINYTLEHSSIGVTATHGFDRQNFTGTNENGLREFSQAQVDYQYEIFKDLTLRMLTSYRYEDQEEITGQKIATADSGTATADNQSVPETTVFNRQQFTAGTSAGYRFWRWYTVNLSYNYLKQDSEKVNDSYDEHRLILSLAMEKELFAW